MKMLSQNIILPTKSLPLSSLVLDNITSGNCSICITNR